MKQAALFQSTSQALNAFEEPVVVQAVERGRHAVAPHKATGDGPQSFGLSDHLCAGFNLAS